MSILSSGCHAHTQNKLFSYIFQDENRRVSRSNRNRKSTVKNIFAHKQELRGKYRSNTWNMKNSEIWNCKEVHIKQKIMKSLWGRIKLGGREVNKDF